MAFFERKRRLIKAAAMFCGVGIVCQFGSCDLGTIETSMTVDGRDAIIQLIRGAILTPLDNWVTNTVNNAFEADS